jgi:hypothetical protein
MKKIALFVFFILAAGAVYAQKYNNGPLEKEGLPWGSNVALFLDLYPKAIERTSNEDQKKELRTFQIYLNPIQGKVINFSFYKDQFFEYFENRGRMSPDNIRILLNKWQEEYGRFDDYDEDTNLFGNYYNNYIHYSETLEIKVTTWDLGGALMLLIGYTNPQIIRQIRGISEATP